MINATAEINTVVKLTLKGTGPGQVQPPDLILLKDGVVDLTPITFAEVGVQSLYNYSFTPTATGTYVLHAYGELQARVEVVTQSLYNSVRNLQDEALGSWQWDKTTGTMVMLRQDGTTLAQFAVVDNLTTSSRERTS